MSVELLFPVVLSPRVGDQYWIPRSFSAEVLISMIWATSRTWVGSVMSSMSMMLESVVPPWAAVPSLPPAWAVEVVPPPLPRYIWATLMAESCSYWFWTRPRSSTLPFIICTWTSGYPMASWMAWAVPASLPETNTLYSSRPLSDQTSSVVEPGFFPTSRKSLPERSRTSAISGFPTASRVIPEASIYRDPFTATLRVVAASACPVIPKMAAVTRRPIRLL